MMNPTRRQWGLVALAALGMASRAAAQQLKKKKVNDGELEYEEHGKGESVLMIHGTGVAATFAPQLRQPALAHYRLIRYHRRGWAGSSRTPVPFTMKDHAADARALLAAFGIKRAHIVGHSFGGCVALQLALDAPDLVHSLVVMEPPIFNPNAPVNAFAQLTNTYNSGDKQGAMNTFSTMSYGNDWRTLAAKVPGGPDQVFRDVDTVFTTEVPAMTQWGFWQPQAEQIRQPIFYLTGGGPHGASLAPLKQWIPRIESLAIPGVTHAMLMQDPKAVSEAIAAFLAKHKI